MDSFQLLQQAGFDEDIALELSGSRGLDEIKQQIEWLSHRNPDRNSLGMLRRAIEGNWLKPDSLLTQEKKQQGLQKGQTQAAQAETDDARVSQAKQEKKCRREKLLPIWNGLSSDERTRIEETTFEQLNSDYFRDRFQKNEEFRLNQCLDCLSQQEDDIAQKQKEKH